MATTTSPLAARSTRELSLDELALARPSRSFWKDAWIRFLRDRLAVMGGIIFVLLCALAVAAPLISEHVTHYDPNKINLADQYAPPFTAKHWFGADEYGRDYLTRIVWAGQISLSIGFLFAAISLTIGVVLGLAAGFYGGWIDDFLQAVINIFNAIPFLPLLIIIGSLVKLGWVELSLILAFLGWTGASRQVRGLVLSIKQRDYVLAARTVGASNFRIMFQHILPNVFSIVLVIVGFDVASAILTESSLSFLGFGVQPPTATWGNMLSNSLSYTTKAPWLILFPGITISLTVLSVFLLADGLRDAMDPRLRR
ncbi:Oligopeptide transport system permease protein OppC [Anaerolineae bacterium]|nr:Oligopeptide transport system permease protein OppC [Anaerolineae bacterium]